MALGRYDCFGPLYGNTLLYILTQSSTNDDNKHVITDIQDYRLLCGIRTLYSKDYNWLEVFRSGSGRWGSYPEPFNTQRLHIPTLLAEGNMSIDLQMRRIEVNLILS